MMDKRNRLSNRWWWRVVFGIACMVMPVAAHGSGLDARRVFDKAYALVFGSEGCRLHYKVNLIGLYKTEGDIWYKGKKSRFVEKRYASWSDGVTFYMVDNRKKTVDIHRAESDKRDKYSGKFKFVAADYTYQIKETPTGYLLTLKPKPGKKGMREVRALINKHTYEPISLRIKVAFMWAEIAISRFKSGGIGDHLFVFPKQQYASYKTTDHRAEE